MPDTPPPPFRADHVGSLLRADAVKAARKGYFETRTLRLFDKRCGNPRRWRDSRAWCIQWS